MNLAELSARLTKSMTSELDYDQEKQEIIAYGLESVFLTILGFTAILIAGILLDALVPAAATVIFGGLLRKLSGGAHFSTPGKCLVVGAIVYSLLGVAAREIINHELYSLSLVIIALLISLVIAALRAPVDCEAKPIHSHSFRQKLKIASMSFIVLTLLLVLLIGNTLINTCAALGVLAQSITLLPVFNK